MLTSLGQIDRDVVRKTHFGGFSDDEEDEGEVSHPDLSVWPEHPDSQSISYHSQPEKNRRLK